MKVIDKINNSGLFAQSAYSADIATRDSNGNIITSTYLTAHQSLDGYATEDWVEEQGYLTAHQDISNKLDSTAFSTVSGDFALTSDIPDVSNKLDTTAFSDVSGTFLTAHQDISNKLDSTAFSTVSGSFLTAHQSITASGNWQDTYETVSTNSAQWGQGGGGGGIGDIQSQFNTINITPLGGDGRYIDSKDTVLSKGIGPDSDHLIEEGESYYYYNSSPNAVAVIIPNYVNPIPSDPTAVLASGEFWEDTICNYYVLKNHTSINFNEGTSYAVYESTTGEFPTKVALAKDLEPINKTLQNSNNWDKTYSTVASNSAQWGQGGHTYTGVSPIVVNNNTDTISADAKTLVAGQGIEINETTTGIEISVTGGGSEYTAGSNIDITNNVISGRDWTPEIYEKLDTTAFSTVSGTFLTAHQSLDDYAKISDVNKKLDTTAFSNVSGSFLTAHQDISNKLDATAFSDVSGDFALTSDIPDISNKLDTTAFSTISGSFLTAHQSLDGYATESWVEEQGYLTAHQDISNKLDTTAFSDVSGTFLTAHQDIANSGNWDSTFETVSSNSAQWSQGGSTYSGIEPIVVDNNENIISANCAEVDYQQIVHDDSLVHVSNNAQYALGVNIPYMKWLMGVDETLLFSSTVSVHTLTASESIYNFKYIDVECSENSTNAYIKRYSTDLISANNSFNIGSVFPYNTTAFYVFGSLWSVGSNGTVLNAPNRGEGFQVTSAKAITWYSNNASNGRIYSVRGVHRKEWNGGV